MQHLRKQVLFFMVTHYKKKEISKIDLHFFDFFLLTTITFKVIIDKDN